MTSQFKLTRSVKQIGDGLCILMSLNSLELKGFLHRKLTFDML